MTGFFRKFFCGENVEGRLAFKWIYLKINQFRIYSDRSQYSDSLLGIFHVVEPDHQATVKT